MSEIFTSLSAAIWHGTGWMAQWLPHAGSADLHLYAFALAALMIGWRGARKVRRD